MLEPKMIDKIASWKYSEEYATEPDHIKSARRHSEELGVEAITPATGNQLALLAALANAGNIVEAGTGAGVSGLWLLSASNSSVLTTIDDEPEYQNVARDVFRDSGMTPNRVRVITGKALAVMGNMADNAYDLVFLDIDPNDVEALLGTALNLLKPHGALLISHALWRDRVPNPALRDDETSSLRNALRLFADTQDFLASISMVGDGLLMVVKK